jgi:hypothetical protein
MVKSCVQCSEIRTPTTNQELMQIHRLLPHCSTTGFKLPFAANRSSNFTLLHLDLFHQNTIGVLVGALMQPKVFLPLLHPNAILSYIQKKNLPPALQMAGPNEFSPLNWFHSFLFHLIHCFQPIQFVYDLVGLVVKPEPQSYFFDPLCNVGSSGVAALAHGVVWVGCAPEATAFHAGLSKLGKFDLFFFAEDIVIDTWVEVICDSDSSLNRFMERVTALADRLQAAQVSLTPPVAPEEESSEPQFLFESTPNPVRTDQDLISMLQASGLEMSQDVVKSLKVWLFSVPFSIVSLGVNEQAREKTSICTKYTNVHSRTRGLLHFFPSCSE